MWHEQDSLVPSMQPCEGGALALGVTHAVAETPSPDVVLIPGGTTTPSQMVDDEALDWLREVHKTTTWTASVCTGSLILGSAPNTRS